MARWISVLTAVFLTWLTGAPSAYADQVTLRNGDMLHGEVSEQGSIVRIQHAILGTVDVPKADVMWISRKGEVPPPPVPMAVERRIAPCAPTAACAPCAAVPDAAVEKCPSPWEFAVGFGFTADHGNTEKLQVNADLTVGYTWGRNQLRWRVNSFYEEANDVQTEGKYFSNLRYTRQVSPRGRLFGLWIVDRDDFADIEIRNGVFGGYQYDFYKTERTSFTGALGAGWITEKRKDQDVLNTAAALAQLEYKHEFASGDSFEALWYAIPYLDAVELSPMRLELKYAHPLRDHFDIVVAFLADYVPEPPAGVDALDTKFTVGVRWTP